MTLDFMMRENATSEALRFSLYRIWRLRFRLPSMWFLFLDGGRPIPAPPTTKVYLSLPMWEILAQAPVIQQAENSWSCEC